MLSRRQFLSITIIMLVLLVLFQLTGVMKDYWNDFQTNEYAEKNADKQWQNAFKNSFDEASTDGGYVVLIGQEEKSDIIKMAEIYCLYAKKDYVCFNNINDVSENIIENSDYLILDSKKINFDADTEVLWKYANQGKSMIFSNIPAVEVIKNNEKLAYLLGIAEIYQDSIKVNGLDLHEGFLLGGRTIYEATTEKDEKRQDFKLKMPWYATYAHVKRYMVGLVDEDAWSKSKDVKNEDMPSVIWRNNVGEARVFVINGNYMDTVTALGIYSAMDYEMNEYLIYPVVNAQNVSVANFAAFSDETDQAMNAEYSRSQQAVFQDLVWPSLNSIFTRTEDRPTFFMSPQLDYSDKKDGDEGKLVYYMKLLGESKAEAGLTTLQSSGIDVQDKLNSDIKFYSKTIPEYKFSSIYMSNKDLKNLDEIELPDDVRTISVEYRKAEQPVSYTEDGLVVQRVTENGFEYKYSDDLRLKSLQTALAYSNILVDMECILYSDDEEDTWEHSSERLASNLVTYWKPFTVFDKTVITESDTKVRQFLNLDYNHSKDENVIYLNIEQFDSEASFILRTHNESVEEIIGGSYEKIEEHAYLIRAAENKVEIHLKEDISTFIN